MTNCMKVESKEWKYSLLQQFSGEVSAEIGRFVFNGLAHPKYAIICGIGVRCDLSELIETGFGNVHPPPVKKSEREKFASLFSRFYAECSKNPRFTGVFLALVLPENFSRVGRGRGCVMTHSP